MPLRTYFTSRFCGVFSLPSAAAEEKSFDFILSIPRKRRQIFSPMTVKKAVGNLKRFSCLMAMTEALIDEQWTSVFEAKHQTVYTYTSSRVRKWNMWNNGRKISLLLCFTIAKPMKNNEETFMNSQKLSTIMWRWSHFRHFFLSFFVVAMRRGKISYVWSLDAVREFLIK